MTSKALKGFGVLDTGAVKRLYREEVPSPVDVLNLIHFKDREAYSWYGVLVAPALRLVGGRVGWIGEHIASLRGESRAEELLVVRYPNHRRFLAMAMSPYYLAVANPVRVRAVQQFEASFTYSGEDFRDLRKSEWVLVVHFNASDHDAALRGIQESLEGAGGKLVYVSRETSPIVLTKKPTRSGTNPLVFKSTAMFRFESEAACRSGVSSNVVDGVLRACDDASLQLYHRRKPAELLPEPLQRLRRQRAN